MRFWRRYRNKVLAISLSALATLGYAASFLVYGFCFGWQSLLSSPISLINIFITLVVYLMVVVTNIQNDNRAFGACSMFVFLIAWRMALAFLPRGGSLWSWIVSGSFLGGVAITTVLLYGGAAVLGVFFYVFLFRYRLGRVGFRPLRGLGWGFAASLAAVSAAEITLYLLTFGATPAAVAYALLSYLPDVAMASAVMFTLERLRRD